MKIIIYNDTWHFRKKNHTMSCEVRFFLLSVQKTHTLISIFPTIIYSSTLFQIKHSPHQAFLRTATAQSASSISANSIVHKISALLDTSCFKCEWTQKTVLSPCTCMQCFLFSARTSYHCPSILIENLLISWCGYKLQSEMYLGFPSAVLCAVWGMDILT